jgi:hypothetical protein
VSSSQGLSRVIKCRKRKSWRRARCPYPIANACRADRSSSQRAARIGSAPGNSVVSSARVRACTPSRSGTQTNQVPTTASSSHRWALDRNAAKWNRFDRNVSRDGWTTKVSPPGPDVGEQRPRQCDLSYLRKATCRDLSGKYRARAPLRLTVSRRRTGRRRWQSIQYAFG